MINEKIASWIIWIIIGLGFLTVLLTSLDDFACNGGYDIVLSNGSVVHCGYVHNSFGDESAGRCDDGLVYEEFVAYKKIDLCSEHEVKSNG